MAAVVDARLGDYLNDKLQTYADLDPSALDALIAGVQEQQKLLKQQLDDAARNLQTAQDASQRQAARADKLAASFQKQQADIDRRLLIVTQSDSSDDVAEKFEATMAKLRDMDIANGYIQMLHHVDTLITEATSNLKDSPEATILSYSKLRNLITNLQPLQTAAEGAAPHLVDHLEKTVLELRNTIRDSFAEDLQKVLDKLLWPKPGVPLPGNLRSEWDSAVAKLLMLQVPELEAQQNNENQIEPLVLLPLEFMVRPLETRFKYHFSGDRATNRLDKPEYFLSHVIDLLDSHSAFVGDFIQPVILRQFRATSMAQNPNYMDAVTALITALLPILRSKAFSLAPQLTSQPQLLSHFIHELMAFDDTLRTDWRYTTSTITSSAPWRGLTFEVLNHHNLFVRWLEVESTFAIKRYESIVETPDSNTLDFDSLSPTSTKPTKAAIRVHDLLSTITSIYKPLQSFSQKIRFLIDIQIAILDRFHARLYSALETFQSLTHSLGRTVQGSSPEEVAKTQGVTGLDRLCRVFASADFLESAMRDWSDDIFFLDLWRELQERVSARSGSGATDSAQVAGSSVADIAQRTSSTLVPTTSSDADEDDDDPTAASNAPDTGALFDESAAAYARLRSRAATMLTDTFARAIKDALRPYTRASHQFASLEAASDDPLPPPTPTLQPAVAALHDTLRFLARALSPLALRAVTRPAFAELDAYYFDRVIAVTRFSALGGRQVRADVAALVGVVDGVMGVGRGEGAWGRCVAGSWVLGLQSQVHEGSEDADEDEAAWGDEEHGGEGVGAEPSVQEVGRRLFADEETARGVLEEYGLERLSVADARRVVRQRVEVSG